MNSLTELRGNRHLFGFAAAGAQQRLALVHHVGSFEENIARRRRSSQDVLVVDKVRRFVAASVANQNNARIVGL